MSSVYIPQSFILEASKVKTNDKVQLIDTPGYEIKNLVFACGNGELITVTSICDGDGDCRDLSDEMNCSKYEIITCIRTL